MYGVLFQPTCHHTLYQKRKNSTFFPFSRDCVTSCRVGLSLSKMRCVPEKNPRRKHLLRDSSSKLPCNFLQSIIYSPA